MRYVLLLVLALAMTGCYKHRSIVGTWSTRADVGSGVMIFRDDLTFRAVRETPLVTMILDGSYQYKGENLKLRVVKWSVPKGPSLSPSEKEAMNREFRRDAMSTVRWTDDTHIRITGPMGELTTAELVGK